MAYIERPRARQDGTLVYRVRWRKGGGASGKREGEPFTDLTEAQNFMDAVNRAGDEWPWGYVPGIGWDHQAYAVLLDAKGREAEPDPPAAPVTTFAQFADEWVDTRKKASRAMRKRYRDDIRLHLSPFFADMDIGDDDAISEQAVGAWLDALFAGHHDRGPLKLHTVYKCHGILSSILKLAVRRKLRSINPCNYTELPSRNNGGEEDEMVFLTREEFHLLAEYLKPDVRDMITVMVNTGLRWGELSALQVQDVVNISGPKPYLRIRRAWKKDDDGSYKLGPPKSRRSRRNVGINRTIARIVALRLVGKQDTDYIFVTPRDHVPWRHNYFYDSRWRPAVYQAIRCETHRAEDGITKANYGGVRNRHLVPCGCAGTLGKVPRIHDVRHTHAAWLIADGASLWAVQRRLGHQSIQVTERYSHLLPEVEDAVVAGLEEGWNRSLRKKVAKHKRRKQALAA